MSREHEATEAFRNGGPRPKGCTTSKTATPPDPATVEAFREWCHYCGFGPRTGQDVLRALSFYAGTDTRMRAMHYHASGGRLGESFDPHEAPA